MPSNPFEQTWPSQTAGNWRGTSSGNTLQGYYNPGNAYGSTQLQGDGTFTPFWNGVRYNYLNDTPDAVWSMFSEPNAPGYTPYDTFFRAQKSRLDDAYQAALSVNPELSRQQFYQGSLGYINSIWNAQAPQQRGINASNLGAGKLQWYTG
jgi:hypothetical protein